MLTSEINRTVELKKMEEKYNIPSHLQEGIYSYCFEHRPVGHFLTAVLENDLFSAMNRADALSAKNLTNICKYIYNEAPIACYGSKEKVKIWLS